MNIKFELYEELGLLIHEEAVMFAAKAAEYGTVYSVGGAGLIDIPALNTEAGDDLDAVAKAVEDMLFDFDRAGCRCGEIIDTSDFEVVYSHKRKEFISVSEMETFPVYMYWDGNNWKYVWLPEPDAIIEVEASEEGPYSLDRWDGSQWRYGNIGCHAEYYRISRLNGEPVEDKYLLRHWSQREGVEPSGEIISSEELEAIKAKAGE